MVSIWKFLIRQINSYTQVSFGQMSSMNTMQTRVVNIKFAFLWLTACSLKDSHKSRPKSSLQVNSIEIKKRLKRAKRFITLRSSSQRNQVWLTGILLQSGEESTRFIKRYWTSNNFKIMKENKKRCTKPTRLDWHLTSSG